MDELYLKHRPVLFKSIRGQPTAVKTLEGFLRKGDIPHAILLTGPSGCGKTTIARILAKKLKCSKSDYREINAADFRGIDTAREIRAEAGYAPLGGTCRVYAVDEAHGLTKDAQTALLKLLEDTPKHVYIILLTTDPAKILPTVITRCTEIKLSALSMSCVKELVTEIAAKEKLELNEDVLDRIVECADGSARKALVLLHQAMQSESVEEQLEAVLKGDVRRQAIDLARALMAPGKIQWGDIKAILKDMDENPESIRRMVLGYATAIIMNGGKMADRAFAVANEFRDNWYDSGKSGLILACYTLLKGG